MKSCPCCFETLEVVEYDDGASLKQCNRCAWTQHIHGLGWVMSTPIGHVMFDWNMDAGKSTAMLEAKWLERKYKQLLQSVVISEAT